MASAFGWPPDCLSKWVDLRFYFGLLRFWQEWPPPWMLGRALAGKHDQNEGASTDVAQLRGTLQRRAPTLSASAVAKLRSVPGLPVQNVPRGYAKQLEQSIRSGTEKFRRGTLKNWRVVRRG